MAVNKVVYGTSVLVDLTSDTVTADKMLTGYTAHDKSGNQVTGNVTFASVYTGSGEPPASLGSDGDFYFVDNPVQISFTIEDATCTANAGQTFSEWIGSGYKTLDNGMMLSVPYGDDGVIFLDEAGVFALSLDGNTPVYGGAEIISGATYVAMNWGG